MKIIISEIPDEGLDVEFRETVTVTFDAGASPVQAQLNIKKIGAEVVVSGNILTTVQLECSRCLKDFRSKFSFPFEAIFRPVEQLTQEEKHELKVEELDMGFYSKDELDLFDIIKEQVLLNLPMKPLCDDLCKGICLKCGADLNAGNCGCSGKDIDSRLVVLKKLLDKET
jgi:uncharacterized protein